MKRHMLVDVIKTSLIQRSARHLLIRTSLLLMTAVSFVILAKDGWAITTWAANGSENASKQTDGSGGALLVWVQKDGSNNIYRLFIKNVGSTKIMIDRVVRRGLGEAETPVYWPTTYYIIAPSGRYASGTSEVYSTQVPIQNIFIDWHSVH